MPTSADKPTSPRQSTSKISFWYNVLCQILKCATLALKILCRGGIKMAHLKKNTRGAVTGLATHFERKTINHSNEDIDPSRAHLNEDLLHDHSDMVTRFTNRLEHVYCMKREDVKALGTWVVTLPEELKPLSHDQKHDFFEKTKDFLTQRYGKENAVAAVVHYDETTPHLHYAFVPVTYDPKKERLKVSAKEVLNRKDLQTFHDDLDKHLKATLPFYEKGIVNGKTVGLESVEQLKKYGAEITAVKQELAHKQDQLREVSLKVNQVLTPLEVKAEVETSGLFKKETGNVIVPKKAFEELKEQAQQSVALSQRNADLEQQVVYWQKSSHSFEEERTIFREKLTELTKKFNQLKKSYQKLVRKVDFFRERIGKVADYLLDYAKKDPEFMKGEKQEKAVGQNFVDKAEVDFDNQFKLEMPEKSLIQNKGITR